MNKFMIICGLSFSGKSTLAKAIVKKFGYEEIDVDDVKVDLYGSDIKDEDLTSGQWDNLYKETDKRIQDSLKNLKTVVDASRNFKKAERAKAKQIAKDCGVKLLTIYVDTPEEIVRQRMLENRRNQARRDISDSDFEDIIKIFEVPGNDEIPLIFQYGQNFESWISQNSKLIQA